MERYYSSTAVTAQLSAGIDAAATTMTVNTTTGYPANVPFTAGIDVDTELEELVNVTAVSGNTFTIQRGYAGTSALDHETGAKVRHMMSHIDFQESRSHEESEGGVHGLSATDVVAGVRGVQTLENKTMDAVAGSNTFLNIPQSSVVGLPEIQTDVNDHESRITVNEDTFAQFDGNLDAPDSTPNESDPPNSYPFGISVRNARVDFGFPVYGQLWTQRSSTATRIQQLLFSTSTGNSTSGVRLRHALDDTSWSQWSRVITDADSLRSVKTDDGTNINGYGNNGVFEFVAPAVGCSFTAPPSGRVMYQTFCRFNVNSEENPQMNWRFAGEIREGTSTAGQLIDPPSNDACGVYEHNTADLPFDMERSVTSPWLEVAGLTPGDLYTAWWKIQNGNGNDQQRLDIFFRQVVVFPLI